MKIIGITGGSGVGKTSVLRMLEKHGLYAIDADLVYHELLEKDESLVYELKSRFPSAFSFGCIDRKRLGQIVFADPAALDILNSITHGYVMKKLRSMLKEAAMRGASSAAVDAAALFESGFNRECDYTIGVIAPLDLRVDRIVARDKLSRRDALTRINAQKDDDYYLKRCSFIIENNGDFTELENKITEILNKINN